MNSSFAHAELIATFRRAEVEAAHKASLIKAAAKKGPKAIQMAVETADKAAKRRDTYAKKLTALGIELKDQAAPRCVTDNQDLERNPMAMDLPTEVPEEEQEPIEEYLPGVCNGRNYMARLCHLPDGPWYIDVIHVESLPPLHDSDRTWLTRDEAAQAADKLVASLTHSQLASQATRPT